MFRIPFCPGVGSTAPVSDNRKRTPVTDDYPYEAKQRVTALIEAMAAALPVASTDVGDVSAMVAPLNRRFVVSADARSLADAINELLDNETLRRDVGVANQERSLREFSEAQMFDAYRRLFATAKPRGSRPDRVEPGDQ
jgi:glycosyltransferase involved in cell wall biosynthesis